MSKEKGGKRALAPKIEAEARELVLPLLEKAGCKLWDVCFEKDGAMWYLRVLFDKDGGLDSDECEEISRPINELFDKQKFIEQVDILEIGTPGLYKKLRKPEHFKQCLDCPVTAQIKTESGEAFISGILKDYNEQAGEITVDEKTVKLSKCVKVNLNSDIDHEFDDFGEIDAPQ